MVPDGTCRREIDTERDTLRSLDIKTASSFVLVQSKVMFAGFELVMREKEW